MRKINVLLLLTAAMLAVAGHSLAQTTSGTLPVLISVSANLTSANKVAISWTMLQKVNTDCFNVEKSSDGISWRAIATVKANSDGIIPCTYNLLDPSPLKGLNFYRIRIRDIGGNIGLTIIKSVRVYIPASVAIYPNPSSGFVNVSLGQAPLSNWTLSIINHLGQVMVQKKYTKSTSFANLSVSNYPAGNYIVEITEGSSRQSNGLMINHK